MKNMNKDLEQIIAQASELVRAIQERNKPVPSQNMSQLVKDVEKLEKAVGLLHRLNNAILEDIAINPEQLLDADIDQLSLSEKEKKLNQQALNLKKGIQTFSANYKKALDQQKKRKKSKANGSSQKNSKQKIKERRKLFKPLGGDEKGWIPL